MGDLWEFEVWFGFFSLNQVLSQAAGYQNQYLIAP